MNYVIQPTDKGDKVLVTVSNKNELETFLSETLTYAFLKPQIDKNEIQIVQENKVAAQKLAAEESSYYADEYASSEYMHGY